MTDSSILRILNNLYYLKRDYCWRCNDLQVLSLRLVIYYIYIQLHILYIEFKQNRLKSIEISEYCINIVQRQRNGYVRIVWLFVRNYSYIKYMCVLYYSS